MCIFLRNVLTNSHYIFQRKFILISFPRKHTFNFLFIFPKVLCLTFTRSLSWDRPFSSHILWLSVVNISSASGKLTVRYRSARKKNKECVFKTAPVASFAKWKWKMQGKSHFHTVRWLRESRDSRMYHRFQRNTPPIDKYLSSITLLFILNGALWYTAF